MTNPRLVQFWSPDPKANKLPSWSPYAFTLDNPVNVIDEDGQWPTWVHNRIIKMAFKGVLTEQEIKTLQRASWNTDNKEGAQRPENSPEHYMRMPGQDAQEAAQKSVDFINKKKEKYKAEADKDALFALGEGMHTIMDETSPAHRGSQLWEGINWKKPGSLLKALGHLTKELDLFRKDEDKVREAAKNIREYYERAVKEKKEAALQKEQQKKDDEQK